MSKINIKVTMKNDDSTITKKTTALFNDEKINYIEEDNTKMTFNYKNNTLIRDTKDLRMHITFKENEETQIKTNYKELDMNINIPIKTKKIKKNNKNIEIEYVIDNEIEQKKILYRIEEIK